MWPRWAKISETKYTHTKYEHKRNRNHVRTIKTQNYTQATIGNFPRILKSIWKRTRHVNNHAKLIIDRWFSCVTLCKMIVPYYSLPHARIKQLVIVVGCNPIVCLLNRLSALLWNLQPKDREREIVDVLKPPKKQPYAWYLN